MRTNKRKTQYCIFALLLSSACYTPQSFAAEEIPAIVVTANKAQEEAKAASQNITVITKEEIAAKQAKSLENIIFSETSVNRTVDAMGRVGISIRGAEARHTLVLVDGQPVLGDVAKYSGTSDEATRLGTENLDRVEITRGAASTRYGSGAIGGVVNVVTKAPQNESKIAFNYEVNTHNQKGSMEKGQLPKNFFLRADSGNLGKVKFAIYGSKRDLSPIYKDGLYYTPDEGSWYEDFRPSLRYYGSMKNAGFIGNVSLDNNQEIQLKYNTEKETLRRYNKSARVIDTSGFTDEQKKELSKVGQTNSLFEPIQGFSRHLDRNNYGLTYKGYQGNTSWRINLNYGKMEEQDLSLLTYFGSGHSGSVGTNILNSVDWLTHNRLDISSNIMFLPNEKHIVNIGFGISNEKAEGSRLKNAPNTSTVKINPWDYDKSLMVQDNTASVDDVPESNVHNYLFKRNDKGFYWDKNAEYFGGPNPPATAEEVAKYSIQDFLPFIKQYVAPDVYATIASDLEITPEELSHVKDFEKILRKENNDFKDVPNGETYVNNNPAAIYFFDSLDNTKASSIIAGQFGSPLSQVLSFSSFVDELKPYVKFNGKKYGDGAIDRNNQVIVGKGRTNKQFFFIEDTYQANPSTIITSILRLDNSNLFGGHLSSGLGITHNINNDPNTRFKANIGTAYAEPGMGELYYNWQMFGSTGPERLGWYWIGNPDLKPETSFNVDFSFEKDTANTHFKTSAFYNKIDNYMTAYFTGQLIDFSGYGTANHYFQLDRIYSFKNIGSAKILGIEAEVDHKWNKYWSTKLGYTYLHARNQSDPTMPKQLLDRPEHKVSLTLRYDNKNTGLSGTLWSDYFIHMLDSNSVNTTDLYEQDSAGNYIRKSAEYKEKTFSIWNAIVNKKFSNSTTAYIGIDNIFNHKDDDRALKDRTYRFGMNFNIDINSPSDAPLMKEEDRPAGHINFYGNAKIEVNNQAGYNRPNVRTTKITSTTEDVANMLADHTRSSSKTSLMLGIDAKLSNNINAIIEGSTDKEQDVSGSASLDRAEIKASNTTTAFSIGRLQETFGPTGYYFNDHFDGAKIAIKGKRTNVTVGYGTFKHSTGIEESTYTHTQKDVFFRSPTINEFFGAYSVGSGGTNNQGGGIYKVEGQDPKTQRVNFAERFNVAGEDLTDPVAKANAKLAVLKEMKDILLNSEDFKDNQEIKDFYNNKDITSILRSYDGLDIIVKDNTTNKEYNWNAYRYYGAPLEEDGLESIRDDYGEQNLITPEGKTTWETILEPNFIRKSVTHRANLIKDLFAAKGRTITFLDKDKNELTGKALEDHLYAGYVGYQTGLDYRIGDRSYEFSLGSQFLRNFLGDVSFETKGSAYVSATPVESLPKEYKQEGLLLTRDKIPAIRNAAYLKFDYKVRDDIQLSSWWLHSTKNNFFTGDKKLTIANIFGFGANYKMGQATLTYEAGINTADVGKYFNGGMDEKATYNGQGSHPKFWLLRASVGEVDANRKGSWNAYLDYKAFEHGSFFGGNGTNAVPDYYLDGIKSFTFGGSYVPMKNLIIEASYTFGARGLRDRASLYGPESFRLGDYSRVQATFKF